MSSKLVCLTIPIYNRIVETQKGLASIFNSIRHHQENGEGELIFKIVVIDDGSTDGSSEWIRINYPEITLLNADGNLWWTGSVNKGAKFAVEELNCDYVVLWNDDTTCAENYFFELEKVIMSNLYDNSILVSKIFWQSEDDILFNFGCEFNKFTGRKKVIGYNKKDSEKYSAAIKVDWSGGMGTTIPASILKKLEYFDYKNFPQYFGDFDFFLRARENGFSSYAIPTLKIFNNRETTGLYKVKNFADYKNLLFSNRSIYNIKQNFKFTWRHSNTIISWIRLILIYSYHTVMLILNTVLLKTGNKQKTNLAN